MVTKIAAGAICGVDCRIVSVEADVSNGLPQIEMVGKLSSEVREAEKRVRSALKNSGISLPPKHITINIAPADISKTGTAYDLPIAVAMLSASGMIPEEYTGNALIVGELGLDGGIRGVRGVLPMAMEAVRTGITKCMVPAENVSEAAACEGIKAVGFKDLTEVCEYLLLPPGRQDEMITPKESLPWKDESELIKEDFADIKGMAQIKRAMKIAAAGFHNMLMIGPPGAGKTMAARRLPGILPPITKEESLEVSRIYSVAGLLSGESDLVRTRPFIAPHHTSTMQALAGGGRIPVPGLISRAHKGVLFLDEVVHFSSASLEVLRQPMEDRKLMIARSNANFVFPAEFMLVAAMNPCPCGNYPDPAKCSCSVEQVRRYAGKLSGPLLDRIDICVEAGRMNAEEVMNPGKDADTESSEMMRNDVMRARAMQEKRFKGCGISFNAQMGVREIEEFIPLGAEEKKFMETSYVRMNLSPRSFHRILKVARTIADLEESGKVEKKHLMEAVCYRGIEERYRR
ncbi:MAG: YifB family Mg chelatase-like AAA ATPase [Lachnospiraceae bacterium]|nr:YifB family Mg chelatase-like AAA ATPase [Lachnospiraceae bacterium]